MTTIIISTKSHMYASPSGVVYQSIAGSALSVLVHSLLLMPLETIKPLLPSLLALLPSVDRLNKALPAAAVLEEQELEWPVQGELCDNTHNLIVAQLVH